MTALHSPGLWRSYLRWMLGAMLAVLLLAGSINVLIDPMDVFGSPKIKGLNAVKPNVTHHQELSRLRRAQAHCADTGIFGNSRPGTGIDPDSEVFKQHGLNAFNYGVPGSSMQGAYRMLLWTETMGCFPKTIVWGADFIDFLDDVPLKRLPTADSDPAPGIDAALLREQIFSINGLVDSVQTLALQRVRYPDELTPRGFIPLHNYISEVEQGGHYVLFRQRAEGNLRQWTIRPVHLGVAEGGLGAQPALFEAGLKKALGHGSKTYIIIYPYHAEIRLMMEKLGLTSLFGEWKRQLVAAVERHSADGKIELWDFSGLTPQTLEAIPGKDDRRTHMVYYWEAGHFKKAMGDLVVGRLLGQDTGIGVRLHAGNVEAVVREDAERVRLLAATPSPLQREVDSLFAR